MQIALITGSAGFIGTNLVGFLLAKGHRVIGFDNFASTNEAKSKIFADNPNYEFHRVDITKQTEIAAALANSAFLHNGDHNDDHNNDHNGEQPPVKITEIYNLACPASPPRYQKLALETIAVCTTGIINMLELARQHQCKILHASTSEVYGDPLEHPQVETYRGNVNPVGPRSCYDEGKRIAETICYEYFHKFNLDIRLIRIFNTYGPQMDAEDGRVVSNLINQAIRGEDLTIYGDGKQTRSFQYISDLISGIYKYMELEERFFGPINLGNPNEFTMLELAEKIKSLINPNAKIIFNDLPIDDPKLRNPNITLAQQKMQWQPVVQLSEGLEKTIAYFKDNQ